MLNANRIAQMMIIQIITQNMRIKTLKLRIKFNCRNHTNTSLFTIGYHFIHTSNTIMIT